MKSAIVKASLLAVVCFAGASSTLAFPFVPQAQASAPLADQQARWGCGPYGCGGPGWGHRGGGWGRPGWGDGYGWGEHGWRRRHWGGYGGGYGAGPYPYAW